MNIINKLTLRHLKKNKRRTLVTIIGVIISVAMVMAVATLGVSFLDLFKRQSIADSGEWHVQYKNVTSNQIKTIEEDGNTEKLILSSDMGYALLEGDEISDKPYLFFKGYNEEGLEQFPIKLTSGRLPEAANEVVVSDHIAKDTGINYEIGAEMAVDIGNRMLEGEPDALLQNDTVQRDEEGFLEDLDIHSTETFTVVGTIERPSWEEPWAPGYTVINYIDQENLNKAVNVDAVVVVKDLTRSIFKQAEQLAQQNDIVGVGFNEELLRYYGISDNDNLHTTMYSLAGIIIAVIVIGSVSLIYNAFAISVSERARHLGMLSSVGATKKQKRNSVFFEGAVIGLISIPIGVLAGLGGIAITFMFINTYIAGALATSVKLEVVVTPLSVLVACLISSTTIFISTYLPARKASKVSAIDAIRQTQDIKLTGKAVKTSKLVRKIFGLEAEIGLKNVKRNKKRYYATLFSLVISIILFLTVSFFTANLSTSVEMSQEGIDFDILVSDSSGDISGLESLVQLEGVTEHSLHKSVQLTSLIDEEMFPPLLVERIKKENWALQEGKHPYYINLYGLSESSFQEYAERVGTDPANYQDPNNPKAIIINTISYHDYEASKFVETESIQTKPGDKLELLFTDYDTNENTTLSDLEIGALTDELLMGIRTATLGGLDVIVPMETFDSILNDGAANQVQSYLYLNSSDPMEMQETLEEVVPSSMYIYNAVQSRERDQQMIMFLSVFTYGFIALISLISIANIFNTISTGISLRKREFAMLKSVGMTPKGFNKMINYESIFYGVNSLLIGLPISIGVMYLLHRSVNVTFEYGFSLPWLDILFVITAIFVIVSSAMLYSTSKIRKENIIDGLKQENI
ncbi:FtsX-like permease family protein [Sutcliffiella horikoshii]|uniref:FtsX-like permease family protein n=1 Tax=Sutcliffiella horikoshii TaxID=79883 RepID=A0A5D4SK29_9BACI|nr:FtsX-like permease family protein [Sutcliffiella horikoshii]TYS62508.1 FtsX-like permease family protein [Sutcliffiella horikoshii]